MTGKRTPSLTAALAISNAMGCSVNELAVEIARRKAKGVDPEVSAAIADGLRVRAKCKEIAKDLEMVFGNE